MVSRQAWLEAIDVSTVAELVAVPLPPVEPATALVAAARRDCVLLLAQQVVALGTAEQLSPLELSATDDAEAAPRFCASAALPSALPSTAPSTTTDDTEAHEEDTADDGAAGTLATDLVALVNLADVETPDAAAVDALRVRQYEEKHCRTACSRHLIPLQRHHWDAPTATARSREAAAARGRVGAPGGPAGWPA